MFNFDYEPTLLEKSRENTGCDILCGDDVPDYTGTLDGKIMRKQGIGLPQVVENEIARHFTRLSHRNFCVDTNFYPLGSCTMKYNPKINEEIAGYAGFSMLHPYQSEDSIQGALEILYKSGEILAELCGLPAVSMQPSAGANGEFAGVLIISEFFRVKGENRNILLVPDSAHGTNPASAVVAGFETVVVKSDKRGLVDIDDLKQKITPEVAGIMMTNPNTLGLFEEDILTIANLLHDNGSLLYYDGANLNALAGKLRPGDMGFDVVHVNLHKTFSTPHGGGGPGAGPICVRENLKYFLPKPVITCEDGKYTADYQDEKSIGRVRSFYAPFLVVLKAYCYMLTMGADGLEKISEISVLNARYLSRKLSKYFPLASENPCMHEFVLSLSSLKKHNLKALDFAKRLIDKGYHPPTVYFPLIVPEAFMVEPTETESLDYLDGFVKAFDEIMEEVKQNPEIVAHSPHNTPVGRLDEVKAVRLPHLTEDF